MSLCVGVAVLELPQDGLRLRMLFAEAKVFSACFGVGYGFSPHAIHGSMLERQRCGCGGMYRLLCRRETNLESKESNEQRNASRALA